MATVKLLEIRDRATFIACVAIDMNPDNDAQRFLLRRCGFPCDGKPNIAIARAHCSLDPLNNDPFAWGDRTWRTAHEHIIRYWHELKDGDVIDVEYILGETPRPKMSERFGE